MSYLAITLLGTFQVRLEKRPVSFATDRARALLAYLALEAAVPHRRETLSALLWPDRPESIARSNLRQTLHRLRSAIEDIGDPGPHLLVSNHDVQFNPQSNHRLDVVEFEQCLETYRAHCGQGLPLCAHCTEALKKAATLYQGEFMAGFSLPGSPEFEFWLLARQEKHHRQALEVIGRLGSFYETTGNFSQAAGCAERLVGLEPWRQSFHQLLMRNLALAGQWNAAMTQYKRCQHLLIEELGLEPSKKTQRLFEAIRSRDDQALRREAGHKGEGFVSGILTSGHKSAARSRSLPPGTSLAGETLRGRFVGREKELADLDGYLLQALAGRGAVVFISGEAGSGKTSLATEFVRRSIDANDSLLAVFGGCDARLGLGDAYQPFRELLRQLTSQARSYASRGPAGNEAERRLRAASPLIRQALAETGPDLPGTLLPSTLQPVAGDLLQSQAGARQAGEVQAALFEQVTGLLRAVAWSRPLILVLDDLHWIDNASANLLFHLGRHLENSHILIIGAYRPEQIGWLNRSQVTTIGHPLLPVIRELGRIHGSIEINLNQAEGRAFVDALVDSEPNRLETPFRDGLFQRTGGNPLFTVEILRGLQDRGELLKDVDGCWVIGRTLNWEQMPARVEATIATRFGRLSDPCRKLLAAASVQGQTFLAEIAAETHALDAEAAVSWLSETLGQEHRLVEADGLEWHDERALSRFRFRHHLFQQYAYRQLDPVSRARSHQLSGLALEELYVDCQEEHALELAGHFEAAGMVEKAIDYLLAAGKAAYRLSANESAIDCIGRALDLLQELPAGPERDRREMTLRLAQTAPLLGTYGYAAPEVKESAERVVHLAKRLDEPGYLFSARLLLLTHYSMRAEYGSAIELGEQLLEQAESEQDSLQLTQAHHLVGHLKFCVGSFRAALDHFNLALAAYDPQAESLLMSAFIGRNMGLTTLFRKAWTLWFLGYPHQSQLALEETLNKLELLGRDHDLAFTLAMGICPLLIIRRELDRAETQARRLQELANKRGLYYFIPFAQVALGAVLAKQGQTPEGQKQIRSGIKTYREGGQKTFLSFCLFVLAESLGEDEEAVEVLDEALTLVEETGERFFEAELWRLRGESLCRFDGNPAEAEACYLRALTIAERQQANSLRLRAATSLARLWGRQDRADEAAQLLGEVLGSFTEGFDTPDIQDAQRLLKGLHHSILTPIGVPLGHE